MSAEVKKLHPLIPAQGSAVVPGGNIWLSASAGTGKTQVLTARVIRLLLENHVEPENLLCITFTKAGASEMADRINQLLASWVQLDDKLLFRDLEAIGADAGPDSRKKARQLFAKVLDAPGGGLQIMTIHSFCQSLLGSFPEEAGLVPGFKPIEGAEQDELLRAALANLVIDAEARGDVRMISDLQELSLDMGEDAAVRFLRRMAASPDVMALIPDDTGAVVWARRLAGVSFTGPAEAMLEAAFADEQIPRAALQSIVDANLLWCKNVADSRGGKRAAKLQKWLSGSPAERAAGIKDLHSCWSIASGEAQVSSPRFTPIDDTYKALALQMYQWTHQLIGEITRAQYADRLARALTVGKDFADQYAKAKHALGAVDFDDLIRRAADLLQQGHMADWVRFKLDRQIDHILVDEAQDTNAAQWNIVSALSDDFFSGMGVKPDKIRTLFSVGDFKQAIYGFQGTAPERYEEAGAYFAERIAAAGSELNRLTLSQSFRSTTPILDFVNAVIEETGAENFGVSGDIEAHYSEKPHIGLVELLEPISAKTDGQGQETSSDDEEDWIGDEKRALAEKLAEHVRALIDAKPWLVSKGRPLEPGDIMFLLRSRGDMASMLVAQLHERNVPVAGVDRLRLLQPLVVQDLLAAIKFVLQPNDDFSLACVLVSPIIGWSQERLLQYGYVGDRKGSLWQHIRDRDELAEDMEPLRDMLAMADFTTVYHFLEQILSGPVGARRKFIARLGSEVVVPIEEMLNAALQFEQQYGGGLQKFLGWFDRGESEIKREGDSNSKEVRIMTVHGAKGLQAPVVILADITSDPTKKPDQSVELLLESGQRVPLLPIRKAEQSGQLEDIVTRQKVRELQEHKRLLYVAMTRAEERLIMAGSLGTRRKGEAPAESWYAAIQRGMLALGCVWEDDARWGRVMRYAGANGESFTPEEVTARGAVHDDAPLAIPSWLFAPAPQEQNPPRPLVPSRLDDDDFGDAPASAAIRKAAMRGKLVHALFERITDHDSLDKAERWLAAQGADVDIDRAELLTQVRAIVQNENWAPFFGPSARAEVPLVAVVGETVINGRIDRLLVEPGLVRAIDFKTGRQVPQDENVVPLAHLRQMAHYRAALQTIFPGHRVEVSLLFTYAPRFITLSDAILAPHYPAS